MPILFWGLLVIMIVENIPKPYSGPPVVHVRSPGNKLIVEAAENSRSKFLAGA